MLVRTRRLLTWLFRTRRCRCPTLPNLAASTYHGSRCACLLVRGAVVHVCMRVCVRVCVRALDCLVDGDDEALPEGVAVRAVDVEVGRVPRHHLCAPERPESRGSESRALESGGLESGVLESRVSGVESTRTRAPRRRLPTPARPSLRAHARQHACAHARASKNIRLRASASDGGTADSDGDGGAAEGRCVRVSPDGRWLAVGDRAGNLRVHALAPGLELQVGLRSGVDALAAGSSRIQVQPNDRIKMCLQPYGEALLAVWRGQDLCPRICFILHHQCPEH